MNIYKNKWFVTKNMIFLDVRVHFSSSLKIWNFQTPINFNNRKLIEYNSVFPLFSHSFHFKSKNCEYSSGYSESIIFSEKKSKFWLKMKQIRVDIRNQNITIFLSFWVPDNITIITYFKIIMNVSKFSERDHFSSYEVFTFYMRSKRINFKANNFISLSMKLINQRLNLQILQQLVCLINIWR